MRRKWLKWVVWILLTPIILFAILMVLLYIPPVQNLIRKQATAIASEATGMDISVERLDLRFPAEPFGTWCAGYSAYTGRLNKYPQLPVTLLP